MSAKTEISSSMNGEFKPLASFPEFKVLISGKSKKAAEKLVVDSQTELSEMHFSRRAVWWLIALCSGLALVVAATLIMLLRQ